MRICLALLVTSILAIAPINRSVAADRFALVIGNAKQIWMPMLLAGEGIRSNDARDVADVTGAMAFTVDVGVANLTGDGMRRAFDNLYGRIKPGSVVLVFFSGFGVQAARQSYMIPVDAQIWTEPDVRRDGFSLETILGEINNRGVPSVKIGAGRRRPAIHSSACSAASPVFAPVIAPNGTLCDGFLAALSSLAGLRQ